MTPPFFFRDSTQAHPNRSLLGQVEVGHTSDSSFMLRQDGKRIVFG
jgi:hypothetical protein